MVISAPALRLTSAVRVRIWQSHRGHRRPTHRHVADPAATVRGGGQCTDRPSGQGAGKVGAYSTANACPADIGLRMAGIRRLGSSVRSPRARRDAELEANGRQRGASPRPQQGVMSQGTVMSTSGTGESPNAVSTTGNGGWGASPPSASWKAAERSSSEHRHASRVARTIHAAPLTQSNGGASQRDAAKNPA